MGRIFLCQNVFLTSLFEFFSRIFRHLATWPWDRSAAHSTQWQDLELTFHNTAREKGKGCVCVSETSGSVDARVSETHVSSTFPCTKQTQTLFSWLLPLFKGLYDTHTQPVSASYRHAKRCVRYVNTRKQYSAYFSYTETVTHVRVWDDDEIRFTSMGAIFKQS